MNVIDPSQIAFILDNDDGTSTIKYKDVVAEDGTVIVKGAREILPNKEIDQIAKMLRKTTIIAPNADVK